MSAVAEEDGRPVGLSLVLYDVNEILKDLRGRLSPRMLFRLLFPTRKRYPKG